jgi:hypothetical protein
MMSHRLLPAALLLCTLAAACGELPTGHDTRAQSGGASYDGGGFGMGGGFTGGDGTGSSQETASGDGAILTGTTFSDSTTRSGGFGMGGG